MNGFLTSRRDFLNRTLAVASMTAIAGLRPAFAAQPSPGALRLLCTAPGGSIPDVVARRYADALGAHYAGGVVVENKPGAAGRLAVAALKQAAPDGATMLLAQGAVAAVYPYLYDKLAYDPVADLQPVSLAAEATLGLAVGPAVPDTVTTLREFIAWTRANPKLANYGSPGAGTLPHLLSALLAHEAKVEWQHIAYAGGPAAMTDLFGGRLACLSLPEGLLRQHHAAGKLRVLATSGATRSAFMPDVPTMVEQGFPTLVVREWFALFMPGGTAPAAVDAASSSVQQAASGGAVPAAMRDMGMLAVASTPTHMAERIATEQRYWKGVLSSTGIRVE
jgi:tripartite-type tricarboxylate transporter receptor subunit TctC